MINIPSYPTGNTYISSPSTTIGTRVIPSTGNQIVYSPQPTTILNTSSYGTPVVGRTPYVASTTYGHAGVATSIPINQKATTTTSYSSGPPTTIHYVQPAPVTYTTT
jgi:hypothetical protein